MKKIRYYQSKEIGEAKIFREMFIEQFPAINSGVVTTGELTTWIHLNRTYIAEHSVDEALTLFAKYCRYIAEKKN